MAARSNASARQRRSGGNDIPGPSNNNNQFQQHQKQLMQSPKLTISDAIALVTLRLGRVEQILHNLPVDNLGQSNQSGENNSVLDDSVFTSIIQRMDALEKNQKSMALQQQQQQQQHQQQQQQQQQQNIGQKAETVPIPESVTSDIVMLKNDVTMLKNEVGQVKNMLMSLQAFTMQTNQRLTEIVFNSNNCEEEDETVDVNNEPDEPTETSQSSNSDIASSTIVEDK